VGANIQNPKDVGAPKTRMRWITALRRTLFSRVGSTLRPHESSL